MVAYLHMTCPNHAKVIKFAAPRAALMRGTHPRVQDTGQVIFDYMISWPMKKAYATIKKAIIKFDRKTTKNHILIL